MTKKLNFQVFLGDFSEDNLWFSLSLIMSYFGIIVVEIVVFILYNEIRQIVLSF